MVTVVTVSVIIYTELTLVYGDDTDLSNSGFDDTTDPVMSESKDSVSTEGSACSEGGNMAKSPSDLDQLKYLERMDHKISQMTTKLNKLDALEQKADTF